MALIVVGASHRTAPVAEREKFVFGPTDIRPSLAHLRATAGVHDSVILSTCNRTEQNIV